MSNFYLTCFKEISGPRLLFFSFHFYLELLQTVTLEVGPPKWQRHCLHEIELLTHLEEPSGLLPKRKINFYLVSATEFEMCQSSLENCKSFMVLHLRYMFIQFKSILKAGLLKLANVSIYNEKLIF